MSARKAMFALECLRDVDLSLAPVTSGLRTSSLTLGPSPEGTGRQSFGLSPSPSGVGVREGFTREGFTTSAIYLQHFNLRRAPFQLTPNTDFFYAGAARGELLDALFYALLHSEGIVIVTGEVGTGKTMLSRVLLERAPASMQTVFVAAPNIGRDELLLLIAEELGLITAERRPAWLLRELQQKLIALHAQGRRVVLVVDEAHAMPPATLEEIRLLSNLETAQHKLLQILLLGQDELNATLAAPALRSFRERIVHRFEMPRLRADDIGAYLQFRLHCAGSARADALFEPAALRAIACVADGLTRRVNVLAEKCLLAAYADGAQRVMHAHALAAIAEAGFMPLSASAADLALSATVVTTGWSQRAQRWFAHWRNARRAQRLLRAGSVALRRF